MLMETFEMYLDRFSFCYSFSIEIEENVKTKCSSVF